MKKIIDMTEIRNARDAEKFRLLQCEFFLDLYRYDKGEPATSLDELADFLAEIGHPKANSKNPLFVGWSIKKRLVEEDES